MRVALFCNDDLTTNLVFAPVFETPGIDVAGVFFVRNVSRKHSTMLSGVLAMRKKMALRYWLYLVATNGVFKLFELLTLALKLPPRAGSLASLRRYAQQKGIVCEDIGDFSDPAFVARINALRIDMLLIRVGAILTPEMLAAPKGPTWCVHSSLLPSFKGIAGEFHALRAQDAPIGSSVFLVTPRLDEGPSIAQVTIARDPLRSVFDHMLRNNLAASKLLAQMLADRLRGASPQYPLPGQALSASYFSWPQTQQVQEARDHGIRLIRWYEWLRLLGQALRIVRS